MNGMARVTFCRKRAESAPTPCSNKDTKNIRFQIWRVERRVEFRSQNHSITKSQCSRRRLPKTIASSEMLIVNWGASTHHRSTAVRTWTTHHNNNGHHLIESILISCFCPNRRRDSSRETTVAVRRTPPSTASAARSKRPWRWIKAKSGRTEKTT